jgi:transposase
MYLSDQIPKKQIARRLGVDVKTVRRVVATDEAPRKRKSPPRGRRLDRFRPRIEEWLKKDPKLTAKRIGTLVRDATGIPLGSCLVTGFTRERAIGKIPGSQTRRAYMV